ncbi:MAG: universal stress protein [Thermoplasmata archaeon]|nr:universal stress protein [Thermoplasmata archaeon]
MQNIKKILIATDGSEHTRPAIDYGIHLAKMLGAKVTALYVVEPIPVTSMPADSSVVFSVHASLESEGKKAVEDVKKIGDEMGVEVTPMIAEGSPEKKILEVAADHDLIVIGTLGRTGLSKFFMGSVAERVTRYAPCPVLVVRGRKE